MAYGGPHGRENCVLLSSSYLFLHLLVFVFKTLDFIVCLKNLFYLSSAAKSPASFGYTENQTILNIVSLEGSSWYMIISCVWIFSDEDDFQSLHLLFVVLFFNHCSIILPSRQGGLSSLNINWNRSRYILLWKSILPSHRFRSDPIQLWNQSFSYKESFLWWLGLVHHCKLRSTDGGVRTSWPMRTTITHPQVTS